MNLGPLQEQCTFLPPEPSLQYYVLLKKVLCLLVKALYNKSVCSKDGLIIYLISMYTKLLDQDNKLSTAFFVIGCNYLCCYPLLDHSTISKKSGLMHQS